ncbi:trypsin-like serine protease [Chelatococcus daeguensis]|nr:trypsin-like serine protease [Chelatococcus daeguensis]
MQRLLPRAARRLAWMTCVFAGLLVSARMPAEAVIGGREDAGPLADASVMVLNARGGVCSGIVLAPDAVLTAAHCVTGADAYRVHYRDEAGEPVLIVPREVVVHPRYDRDAIKARRQSVDLALVRLPEPLPATFAAATLSRAAAPREGARMTLGGWGVAAEGDHRSTGTFRALDMSVVEPYGPGRILVWLGNGPKRRAGACDGDSGGPIADAAGRVVAVTGFARGEGRDRCGLVTQGTLVAPERAFIDGTLRHWGREANWAE